MRQNILLVDDDEAVCKMVSRFLNSSGYQIFTASNSKQALQIAAEIELSLLILDIGFSDENGLELMDVFRATYPRLPVIVLQGCLAVEKSLRATQASAACMPSLCSASFA